MDFDDLIIERSPPPNRAGKADHDLEHHFYEGAVMLAYAMHLLRTEPTKEVRIHPDGEHGKQFDFAGWLGKQGFTKILETGKTAYGGTYEDNFGRRITLHSKPGLGDVVTDVGGIIIEAECKGGIINTRHPGQNSRLDKGLCEVVGRLMTKPSPGIQVAVVPFTKVTERLAERLAPRCATAGIKISLVRRRGQVIDVTP
jgi:hypothetical protein